MLVTVHIPAYHAGQDFPARQVRVKFPGLPPEGLQIVVRGQNAEGVWREGIVEIVTVRVDPGWALPSNCAMDDNLFGGYLDVQAFTNWVRRPNG